MASEGDAAPGRVYPAVDSRRELQQVVTMRVSFCFLYNQHFVSRLKGAHLTMHKCQFFLNKTFSYCEKNMVPMRRGGSQKRDPLGKGVPFITHIKSRYDPVLSVRNRLSDLVP